MRATGYLRRSKKAEDNTVSLQEQERQVREYCTSKGLQLASIVTHNGISGAKRSRFEEIHRVISQSGSKVLVVYNLDRLARDAAGLLDNIRLLARTGVAVHEVGTGPVDLSRSSSKLSVSVRGAVDEFFRDVISEKTTDALRYKRESGERYSNLPPFGYAHDGNRLVPHTVEQGAMKIIRQCQSQGLGARRTQRALIESGYQGRMGVATIHRLLKGVGKSIQCGDKATLS